MNHDLEGSLLVRSPQRLLEEGINHELAGRTGDAMECYAAAVDVSGDGSDRRVRADALRRLGILHHLRAEPEVAADLCQRSLEVALEAGADDLAANAHNALAGFAMERGDLDTAAELYAAALGLAGTNLRLTGKIEQNLGIIASIRGDWAKAGQHYEKSLLVYQTLADERGCATAHHNLGMIHAKRKEWQEADRHYRRCHGLAEHAGDRYLGGLAALNRAEVRLAIDDWEGARLGAQHALRIFNEIEARRDKAGAHRLLGMVFRNRRQTALAESHLRSALEIAAGAQCPLTEADAARELARLYQAQGRREAAHKLLERARTAYRKTEASADLAEIEQQFEAGTAGTPLNQSSDTRGAHASARPSSGGCHLEMQNPPA